MSGKPCALLLVPLLSGCDFTHAPAIAIAGSYFPAWMLCTVVALIATVLIRVVLIRIGLDDRMPWRVAAYSALALALTFALLLLAFTR
ncbi:MAG: YtcA family lipoprotein [Pigmentiphaga sp.]